MTTFYAQSYQCSATGFYFDSLDEFKTGMLRLARQGIEEVEIQFIDGDKEQYRLFNAANLNQATIHNWFEQLETLGEINCYQLCFLLDCGYSLDEALEKFQDVQLYLSEPEDYAQDLIEETTDIPDNLRFYIDYKAIARDMEINGEIVELEHNIYVINALEF